MKKYLILLAVAAIQFSVIGKETRIVKDSIQKADSVKYAELYEKLNPCKTCPKNAILIYDFSCQEFYYDFKRVTDLSKLSVNYNKQFKFGVVNLNRYIYNIELSTDDVDFKSEPPALFNQLFLGNGSYINDIIPKLVNSDKSVFTKEQIKFYKALDSFQIAYNQLIDRKLSVYNICDTIYSCCGDTIKRHKYSDFAKRLLELKFLYQEYAAGVTTKINSLDKLLACVKEKEEKMSEYLKEKDSTKRAEIKAAIEILECKDEKRTVAQIDAEKTLQVEIKSNNAELWASLTKVSEEDLIKLILFTNNLVVGNFSYVSPPIYPKGNLLNIGYKINKNDSSLTSKWNVMPLREDSGGIELFVKHKWYVSFTSGPFVAFGRKNTFKQDLYNWQQQPDTFINGNGIISDTSRYKLITTGKTTVPVGLAAFANFGVKITKNVGFGGTVGVGIVIEKNPQPIYFLGSSLYFGTGWHQFNISLGVALTQVRVKSGLYVDNRLYSTKPADVEYSKKMIPSGFVSVSYTLFSSESTRKTSSKSKQ